MRERGLLATGGCDVASMAFKEIWTDLWRKGLLQITSHDHYMQPPGIRVNISLNARKWQQIHMQVGNCLSEVLGTRSTLNI